MSRAPGAPDLDFETCDVEKSLSPEAGAYP